MTLLRERTQREADKSGKGGMSRYMRQVGIKKRKHVSLTRSEDVKLGWEKK